MRKSFYLIILFSLIPLILSASTRSDVNIIESSENIRYLSQKITKEYLYLYHNPKKINLKNKLLENMKKLEENIHAIKINTQSDESKNILNFLSYNNEEIKVLLEGKITRDNSILMLDYSETFVEAANSIQYLHQYDFSSEEKMLMKLKELEYLFERVNKYYVASVLELNKTSNLQYMNLAIEKIEAILKELKNYYYPRRVKKERTKILTHWKTNKKFLQRSQTLFIPNLLLLFTKELRSHILKLELYHKQNQ